jgi:hypothetical protein
MAPEPSSQVVAASSNNDCSAQKRPRQLKLVSLEQKILKSNENSLFDTYSDHILHTGPSLLEELCKRKIEILYL